MVRVEQVAQTSTADVAGRAIRRIRRRLIPFLALLYFIAYLDRVNVGFAALQMNAALGLTPLEYGRGARNIFLGYFIFEVPSNLALARIGARIWIARIAIVWGLVSMAGMFVVGPRSFNAVRFLLGAAEAGFFPGIVLYFTGLAASLVRRISACRACAAGGGRRRPLQCDAAVLVAANGCPARRQRRRGHRSDQLGWESRRICRAVRDGLDAGSVGRFPRRPSSPRRERAAVGAPRADHSAIRPF